jgi:predicted small lipoprotein YifL
MIHFLMVGCGQIGVLYLPSQAQENDTAATTNDLTQLELTDVR